MQSQSFTKRWSKSVLHAGAAALVVSSTAMADDTEVFAAQIAASAKPNLVFVLDYSGSMNDALPGATDSKISILRTAVKQVLAANNGKVNASIGSLYSWEPSGVQWPLSDLAADANTIDSNIPAGAKTVEEAIGSLLDHNPVGGATATVDALAEAAAYFQGAAVYHNGKDPLETDYHAPKTWNVANDRFDNNSRFAAHPGSYLPADAYQATGGTGGFGWCDDYTVGGLYPDRQNGCAGKVTSSCELIAANSGSSPDGGTWSSSDRNVCKYEREDRWAGATYKSPITAQCQAHAIVLVSDGEPTRRHNNSQIEGVIGDSIDSCDNLSSIFKFNNEGADAGRCGPEVVAELANNPQVPGIPDSVINTYTVGFDTDGPGKAYLEELATAGNGGFFEATSPESLTSALNAILNDLTTTSQSFAPLAVDVDRANFAHENRVFYSLFKPSGTASWGGNLKGYFVDNMGLVDINNIPATELQNGVRVMSESAQSFWSQASDGDAVTEGGASAKLSAGGRTLLTYASDAEIPAIGVALAASGNHDMVKTNTNINDAMLGGTGNRDALLDWIQTAPMGDPLHSQPVKINYGTSQVMYVMTNQGFIHAIDATAPLEPNGLTTGGEELFAFMPRELLTKLPGHYTNETSSDRIYGLDGDLIRWHTDENKDGIVNGTDKVMLVFGMRRGGSHYYALDVTNPNSPRLMWRIDGGSAKFPRLGETWSRPSLVNVLHKGVEKEVLAFGGGYDAAQLDGSTTKVAGTMGNAIYMVDRNKEVVMSIDGTDVSGMDYAIPSDLTLIDIDGDDLMDRIYVGDLGGNLWRIDFDDIDSGVTGTKLADLNDGGHRSFFYPPSVALNSSVYGDFLSISIGSGNRTNPLRVNSNDRIYMVRDTAVTTDLPGSFTTVLATNLYNATTNDIGSADSTTANNARDQLNDSDGWFINLGAHEKALSPLVTFSGRIMATTFDSGDMTTVDPCEAIGTNRFYMMDLATAQPVPPDSLSGVTDTFTAADRSTTVNGDGILPQPTVLFPESGDVSVLVDNEVVSMFPQKLSRIFWHSR